MKCVGVEDFAAWLREFLENVRAAPHLSAEAKAAIAGSVLGVMGYLERSAFEATPAPKPAGPPDGT
jgi:hypothetical protein